MLDKFIYKCCDFFDKYTEWMNNFLFAPRCKCKKKKNESKN